MKDSVIDGKWHTSQRCLLDIKDFNFCKKSNISLLLAGGKRRSARVWPSEEAQWSAARGVYNYTGFHFYRNWIISFLEIELYPFYLFPCPGTVISALLNFWLVSKYFLQEAVIGVRDSYYCRWSLLFDNPLANPLLSTLSTQIQTHSIQLFCENFSLNSANLQKC